MNIMSAAQVEKSSSKKRRKNNDGNATAPIDIDTAVDAEMLARMNRAKAAAGPILLAPAPHESYWDDNSDLEKLSSTQLEHETMRLQARLKAIEERKLHLAHLAATGKRVRRKCFAVGCNNVAHRGGVCKRHGAPYKRKMCRQEGCNNQAQRGGVCYSHGAKYKLCSVEGCTNKIQSRGVCCKHGANKRMKSGSV